MKLQRLLIVPLLITSGHGCMRNQGVIGTSDSANPSVADQASPAGLPAIGKWMLAPDDAPAHWLNQIYDGKNLREPVNVIIVDRAAKSAADATDRLLRALAAAGFPLRVGHSTGYSGLIGGVRHGQLGAGKAATFSDEPFELKNNHGRIFGPYHQAGAYVFTAAFSREKVDPFAQVKHEFVSFNQARDALATRLERKTHYHRTGLIPLENAVLGHPALTTGDHDGIAVLLEAKE
ncbi:MAG: hypothetical protein NTV49_11760 [Kiritimatiellaeota bacterium]|nr:hypothetical protein [Kiritimatiellota bacterium]